MKTSGRIVRDNDRGKGQEKAAGIICREKARTMKSLFQKEAHGDAPGKECAKSRLNPLIFYLILLAIPLVGFAASLHLAAPGSPLQSPGRSDNTRATVTNRAPGTENAAPDLTVNGLPWYDDYEEFWNIISEKEVPLAHKKEWVHRLFRSNRAGAYAYFTLNIYDFSHDEPLRTVIDEVCVEHGFPAIVFHDKAGLREELSGSFSPRGLLWILAGSPVPLVIFLFGIRLSKRSGIWEKITFRLKRPFEKKKGTTTAVH